MYKSLKFKTCQIFDKKFYKICHLVSENITQLYLEVFLHVKHFVIMKKAIFSLFIIKVPRKFYLPKKKKNMRQLEVSPHQNSTSWLSYHIYTNFSCNRSIKRQMYRKDNGTEWIKTLPTFQSVWKLLPLLRWRNTGILLINKELQETHGAIMK